MRIRYKNNESVQTFRHSTNGAEYKVILDYDENMSEPEVLAYQIVDAETRLAAAEGKAKDHHELLKEVKKSLQSLGIDFDKETRKRLKLNGTHTLLP